MKKVVLINSPIYDRKVADKEDYLPPLGLGYIATEMERNGIDVQILDAVFNNYTINEIIDILNIQKPEFVGVNIFSVNFDLVKQLIERYTCKTTFLVGGKTVKHIYKDILSFNTPNKIICTVGEGEYVNTAIVLGNVISSPKVHNGDNRLAYFVDKDSPYFPKDISSLTLNRKFFLDRQIINPYSKVEEAIVTSRECIYNCAFCGAARSINRDSYARSRKTESIVDELTQIKNEHPHTQSIRVLDDLFLRNRESIKKAVGIFSKFDYDWRAMCHIKSLVNNTDLLPQLAQSKCRELEIGIESGNADIRKYIHKESSLNEVKEVIYEVLINGINVKAYFILGFPTETYEQCLDTFKFAKELAQISRNTVGNFRVSAFQFRPYHGTELFGKISGFVPKYTINNNLNNKSRQQFNFTAGNFSNCPQDKLDKLINMTNNLSEEEHRDEYAECQRM